MQQQCDRSVNFSQCCAHTIHHHRCVNSIFFSFLESNCISSTSRCYLRFNVTMLISHQPSVCVDASKSKSKLRALRRVTCSLEQQINSLPFSSLFSSSSLLFPSSFALCAGQLEYEKTGLSTFPSNSDRISSQSKWRCIPRTEQKVSCLKANLEPNSRWDHRSEDISRDYQVSWQLMIMMINSHHINSVFNLLQRDRKCH